MINTPSLAQKCHENDIAMQFSSVQGCERGQLILPWWRKLSRVVTKADIEREVSGRSSPQVGLELYERLVCVQMLRACHPRRLQRAISF